MKKHYPAIGDHIVGKPAVHAAAPGVMCPDRDQHVATDGIKTITHNCPAALEFGAGHLIKATIHFHFRPFKKLPLRSASVARSSEIEMITQSRTGVILAEERKSTRLNPMKQCAYRM